MMKSNVDVKYVLINRDGEEIVSRANFNWNTGVVTPKEEISEELLTTVIDEKIMIENSVLELDMFHLSETGERKVVNYVVISQYGYEKGYVLGENEEADCGVEDCTGIIFDVIWVDGEITECCSKGLDLIDSKTYKIKSINDYIENII